MRSILLRVFIITRLKPPTICWFFRKQVDALVVACEGGSKPDLPTVMERRLMRDEQKEFQVASRDGLRDEILNMILAGKETTEITSITVLYHYEGKHESRVDSVEWGRIDTQFK